MNDDEALWPSTAYHQQVEQLRGLIGQPLYVVEIHSTEINAGVHFPGKPLVLLAIVDFPRPDPYRQLCPHLLILDDGRGVNLGRVARISRGSAYAPTADDIVFSNQEFVENVLFAPRKFSRALVAATSRLALGEMLGKTEERLIEHS
ncbi:hypothetical protein [Thiothrix winogradskyi]|uniref:CheW-like domain-containing protein n=1 Tax=Thiothrix winogradskyi TaxID=96472 RepID=A0ABY3SZ07_9GAMM|nr:hypothetical protein [Thiothrix winogradskyi]UJS24722.1 hypothetical protein L2Y54_01415 [Thiothrix winogradskyi]